MNFTLANLRVAMVLSFVLLGAGCGGGGGRGGGATPTPPSSGGGSPPPPPAATLSFGSFAFLEEAGRPLHAGSFPIQGNAPTAGAVLGMSLNVFGPLGTADYQFVDSSGIEISSGTFSVGATSDSDTFVCSAQATIPTQPFKVSIHATGTDATSLSWQSVMYTPPAVNLKIAPATALLAKGQTIPVTLHVTGGAASGSYSVHLTLPAGFTGSAGPWPISVAAGQTVDVTTSITAPSTGDPFAHYTVLSGAVPTDTTQPSATSSFEFEVE